MKVERLLTLFFLILFVILISCRYDFTQPGLSLSLTVIADSAGTTIPAGSVTSNSEKKFSIKAIANTGYKFSHWSLNSGEHVRIFSSLTETTEVQLLATDATIQAHFTLNDGIRTTNIFREDFTKEAALTAWTSYGDGKGETCFIETEDGTTAGGRYLQIGNNNGNDQLFLISDNSLVFDPSKLYQIRCRIRRVAGTGTVSIGLAGRNATDNMWVNTDGPSSEITAQKQHYFVTQEKAIASSWEIYTGYFEGTAASPVITESPNPFSPGKVNTNVVKFRPALLINYSSASGICELNYLEINEVKSFTLFAETFGIGNPEVRWLNYSGSGEVSLINSDEALTGNRLVRIGNNKDNDQIWWISTQVFPFNRDWLYQIRCRIRKTVGDGVFYLGVAGLTQPGGVFVNTTGVNSYSSQHYFAAASISSFNWQEYCGYFKGSASTSTVGQHSDITNPGTLYPTAGAFSPLLIVNYSGLPGIMELDYFLIDVIKDTSDLPIQADLPLMSLGS